MRRMISGVKSRKRLHHAQVFSIVWGIQNTPSNVISHWSCRFHLEVTGKQYLQRGMQLEGVVPTKCICGKFQLLVIHVFLSILMVTDSMPEWATVRQVVALAQYLYGVF